MILTDDIRLPFYGEKRKLRAARGSGITATKMIDLPTHVASKMHVQFYKLANVDGR